jgi:arsenate reductase
LPGHDVAVPICFNRFAQAFGAPAKDYTGSGAFAVTLLSGAIGTLVALAVQRPDRNSRVRERLNGLALKSNPSYRSERTPDWRAARNDAMAKTISRPPTIYGIKNCDTMKKARAWLDKHGIAYAFHDYKTAGVARAQLETWCRMVGWETLVNRAGTSFRKLPDKDKNGLDAKKAVALMLAQPSLIKRPVLDLGGDKLLVGFTPELYRPLLGSRTPR